MRAIRVVLAVLLLGAGAHAQWRPIGPDGGDAHSLSVDPGNHDHILLGTTTGEIYSSTDGGRSWTPWVHLGVGDDYAFDHIVFDSSDTKTIYVAAWSVQREDGDLFRTRDAVRSWERVNALRGKSIRALAQSASDPRVLVAVALDGIFRSTDGGENWTRITPKGHTALRNFESLAIDAHAPNTIYAGTWHLPWKTSDGGKTWQRIKQGIIDDSDVFSILIDRTDSQKVFASACSGIYRSNDAGQQFRKVQGIPGLARRTLLLRQDPRNASVIYAGTTQGLWKSFDAGKSFQLASDSNSIVNDIAIDPQNPNHILLATDRGGVILSDDGAKSFRSSNTGFAQRRISGVVVDGDGTIAVSVLHDREHGGVLRRGAKSESWEQLNCGLGDAEVLDLQDTPDGELLAATTRGVMRWNVARNCWESMTVTHSRTRATSRRVNALSVSAKPWFAATDRGLLQSADHKVWTLSALAQGEFLSVAQSGRRVAASNGRKLFLSDNAGVNWNVLPLPAYVTRIRSVAFTSNGVLWIATPEGALRLAGTRWEHVLNGLPARELRSIRITRDRTGEVIVCTADNDDRAFISRDGGEHFIASEPTGFSLSSAFVAGDQMYAITGFRGLMIKNQN